MAKADVWPTIHAERQALAADLETLSDEQWGTTSLCSEWTVRDALAHMTATAKISPSAFFGKIITSGFSLNKVQAKDITTEKGASPAETLARFKAQVTSSKHPPGPTVLAFALLPVKTFPAPPVVTRLTVMVASEVLGLL